jgi:hypothetical protein
LVFPRFWETIFKKSAKDTNETVFDLEKYLIAILGLIETGFSLNKLRVTYNAGPKTDVNELENDFDKILILCT